MVNEVSVVSSCILKIFILCLDTTKAVVDRREALLHNIEHSLKAYLEMSMEIL